MKEDSKKKQIVKISVFITSIFIIFLSVTYAFINQTLVGTKRQVITSGNLELELLEDENNLAITDALPMYDEVGMIQDAFTFRLVNKTSMDTNYILKLDEIAVEGGLLREDVKYGLTKDGEVTIDLVSNIVDNTIDEGVILGNQTIEYSLRLWVKDSVTDISRIQNKSMRFKVNMSASQKVEVEESKDVIKEVAFAEENLGELCKTYNDGVDTFLVGQCSQNYVWYSGKLWRVVLKNNETGAVKLITDNGITSIPYNSETNKAFQNSYVDEWLQQEFLSTLHDYEDYLVVDSIWDETMDSSRTPTRPNGDITVNRAVGLLNYYEYYTTHNNSDGLATNSTGYLINQRTWRLITPYSSTASWCVYKGGISNRSYTSSAVVRPVVNMKAEVKIVSGTGEIDNPYKLEGDIQETINGETFLSTRYSGEYIHFNNELYRIVSFENDLTKILAVDPPSSLEGIPFHNVAGVNNFSNASIKNNLNSYYQGMDAITQNMVEQNMTWYLGKMDSKTNYKASICMSVDTDISIKNCEKTTEKTTATVGLSRVGEMFNSYISRRAYKDNRWYWTLTPTRSTTVYAATYVINDESILGIPYDTTSTWLARPSMYLKSNVVIASSNTGDGTYEHPYDIELK